jgi:type IV secretion system protein VirB2
MIANLIRLGALTAMLRPARPALPKGEWRHLAALSALSLAFTLMAFPALAQSIDLSPIQNLLQGIVDAITGPLGIVIGTLALIGVFLSWLFGILDFRQAMWVLVGIAGVAAAPTIVSAIWGGGE